MFLEINRPKGSDSICVRYGPDGAKPLTLNLSAISAETVGTLLKSAAGADSKAAGFSLSFSIETILVEKEPAPAAAPTPRKKAAKKG